jgi:hypothetical protein
VAVVPVLKRFDRYFYVNASPTNPSQVPAVGGTVAFYGQGATVSSDNMPFPNGSTWDPLPVYHPGSFNGTQAQPNAATVYGYDGIHNISVWLNSNGTIGAKNTGGADFTLYLGDRVVNVAGVLQAYRGPLGTDPISVVTDNSGRAQCYITAYRYDYVFTPAGSGAVLVVFIDAEGSYVMR